ncbi:fatty-acid--CoA ligase [Mycolicibacterium agri]|uniref:Fatty-acid--CoA ligase n=1 Tax=Mycolicibacterium agri TaxID=36811 RepID=A0A2A7N6Q3_MYCAG|nr:fatty acyl-AMP ligase [Mycolicibacterium agri]PEG39509.1 fatty-acid--CoA ligase [Mycolicibacterium agri]GFG48661.1 nitrate ABC transporter substrate-binding protein [Mycolicibacterium agri]
MTVEPRVEGLLQIEDILDSAGNIALPSDVTLISLIERNIANVGDTIAYRYLDHTRSTDGYIHELTWTQLGVRMRAIAARVQQVASAGDRVAILAPQGLDYVAGFFAAIKAGTIAVPLFAPELQGHTERLAVALHDSRPSVVLTTSAASAGVDAALAGIGLTPKPHVIAIDEVPDSAGETLVPVHLNVEDVSHLQYTSGSTREPVGVEVTHLAVGTNLAQMILSIDLLDRNTHGCSWLPLYHDMGLSMIGFPTVYGGHSTLMSPTAFIRRPQRWIYALSAASREGRVVTAAPNFACEYTAQRGLPEPGDDIDLSNVVLILGSEPVSMRAIESFNAAFGPYGLPPTAIKPSYGIAEATLFVSTIAPTEKATVAHLDAERFERGEAVRVPADTEGAVTQVSCGHIARSQWAVIVDSETSRELPDGRIGEIWLCGNNIGRGYWGRPEETRQTFGAELLPRPSADSHADGAPDDAGWLRTGDLGFYLDGELYVTGRIADAITVDDRRLYPEDIEATTAEASPMVRRGYVTAFTVPVGSGAELVLVAERASGTRRADPAPAIEAIRAEVSDRHGLSVNDVRLVPAGTIPRTTSGKLARRAARAAYLAGDFGT